MVPGLILTACVVIAFFPFELKPRPAYPGGVSFFHHFPLINQEKHLDFCKDICYDKQKDVTTLKSKIRLSQDCLKIIACITMLVDHIGAILFPKIIILRIIGRIAFPIYCFLLTEGYYHTKNKRKYFLRLIIGAIISEYIYDLAIFNQNTWRAQSVMVTLTLGFNMLHTLETLRQKHNVTKTWQKICIIIIFAIANEFLNGDYGIYGIILIAIFATTQCQNQKFTKITIGTGILSILYSPTQIFAILSVPIIKLYNNKKTNHKKLVQIGFYLFYPVHLIILHMISHVI